MEVGGGTSEGDIAWGVEFEAADWLPDMAATAEVPHTCVCAFVFV